LAHSFDCDSPPGRVSRVLIPLPDGDVEVSGEIVINEIRGDDRWAPGANIFLHRIGEDADVGVRLAFLSGGSKEFTLQVQDAGSQSASPVGKGVWANEAIPFKVSLSVDGELTVQFGRGAVTQRKIPHRPAFLSLACTTGDFSFREVYLSGRQAK